MSRGLALAAALLALTSCAPPLSTSLIQSLNAGELADHLDSLTYRAVDQALNGTPEILTSHATVVVGSIEDIRDVNSSTPFGNIVSEMIRTRLVERGIHVQDIRVRSNVLLKRPQGEMLLSRDPKNLLPPPGVTDYVTGTYAVGSGKVYVSLKIVGAVQGQVEAASDFVANRSSDVDQLLDGG
jgi:TolB-like protein